MLPKTISGEGRARGVIGDNPAVARASGRRAGRRRADRPPVRARARVVDAPPRQPRHRRAQPAPQAQDPALQARPPPPADRAADVRPRGAEGRRGRGQGPRRAQERHPCARPPLRQGDRAGLLRLYLFPRRRRAGQEALDRALPRAARRLRRADPLPGAARCLGGVRHQPPLQHGLRARHVPRVGELGAELRGRRMGARVGAAEPDPRHGRLLRAPRQLQRALSQNSGALRAHGHHLGRCPGRVPRRRPHPRRLAAPAQARPAQLHGVGLRSQRPARHRVRARRHQLRPRAGGPRAHGRRVDSQGRAPALRVQPAGALRLAREEPVAARAGASGTATAMPVSASARPCRCAPTPARAASTSAPCRRASASPRSSGSARS